MKFSRLRVLGFKSFVEAADFHIETGLTGVVGPNGCGKSNLVEALRWVMGENSHKNMRAAGMDEVIFSGSGERPARNTAEVGLVLDNTNRSAPSAFNDADIIEVTRRIERDSGSTFRINGREVRARDVQLLFADASTGARSPAMVRQGQIGEIISAKPQARRRILEEAAGIAGLHSRRHEAELRLKGADENVTRLDDVLKQIDAQIDSLKRQARQATRYKGLAANIHRHQALLLHLSYRDAETQLAEAERKLDSDTRDVAERTRGQAEAARRQAGAAHALPGLRDDEAKSGAALQRLVLARQALDGEERRATERAAELDRRIAQLTQDLARETLLIEDAAGVLSRLDAEDRALADDTQATVAAEHQAKLRLAAAEATLGGSEKTFAEAQSQLSDTNARRATLERTLRDEAGRVTRLENELGKVEEELRSLKAGAASDDQIAALLDALEAALANHRACDAQTLATEASHGKARDIEAQARAPLNEAERDAQRIETEVRTLDKLLTAASDGLSPPVVEDIRVAKGYEAALGAALGEDLDASTDPSAPAHWSVIGNGARDPALPLGITPLSGLVEAPQALARRLAQIGVVTRGEGAELQKFLQPGQRLVSKEGDLWRWDGFAAAAEAPTPAARRLAEKNRLGDLQAELLRARSLVVARKAAAERAQSALRSAAELEREARQTERAAAGSVDEARQRANAAERKRALIAERVAALEEAASRLAANRDEVEQVKVDAQRTLADLAATADLVATLEAARALVLQDRAAAADARAVVQGLAREAELRARRRQTIAHEYASWMARQSRADEQVGEVSSRLDEAIAERKRFDGSPGVFLQQRRALLSQIDAAEVSLRAASDARVVAEAALTAADTQARAALDAMSASREERARTDARVEATRQRRDTIVRTIAYDLDCEPVQLPALADIKPDEALPDAANVERTLEGLKSDRERLGAVNLRADEELVEVETQREGLMAERNDLTEAIRKLRVAIQNLNKEGRERLVAAFDGVNGHFKALFTTLFGGGSAELQLVESEDPLEAGLEVVARPPGKKPQTMSLLSGGEQALTALSLIFAVFLTNPSPICVLDEVDAPLDDANVERFCDLLDEMAKRTDTRFVTITHNPITMARMNRLFGVTMGERGVSQLVSVDLETAEQFRQIA